MTAPTPDQLERLVAMAEDNEPAVILDNLQKWALDGNSPHAEAVLMAEAAITLSASLRELDQARQMLADAPHGDDCMFLTYEPDSCTCWKAGV